MSAFEDQLAKGTTRNTQYMDYMLRSSRADDMLRSSRADDVRAMQQMAWRLGMRYPQNEAEWCAMQMHDRQVG